MWVGRSFTPARRNGRGVRSSGCRSFRAGCAGILFGKSTYRLQLAFMAQRGKPGTIKFAQRPECCAATQTRTARPFHRRSVVFTQSERQPHPAPSGNFCNDGIGRRRRPEKTRLLVSFHPFPGGAHACSKARRHRDGGLMWHPPPQIFSPPAHEFGLGMVVHLLSVSLAGYRPTLAVSISERGEQPIA